MLFWVRRYLSLVGRITLIKSVFMNLPVYYLSIFEMPIGIARKIEQMFRKFLQGDKEAKRKIHLVKWEEVIKPKSEGGLGIVPLRVRNHALLCKWSRRFGREREVVWTREHIARYGLENNGGGP